MRNDDTRARVRCAACNSLDIDELADGSVRCDNCGADLTRFDGQAEADAEPDAGVLLIYPLLIWSWAPCQKCGSTHGESGGPEDSTCWECGAALLALKRRACAEGFPIDASPGTATEESREHHFAVGDRGVSTAHSVDLVGGGPFTLLQVIHVRLNGDLDVAATADGTIWMGIPQRDLLHLA